EPPPDHARLPDVRRGRRRRPPASRSAAVAGDVGRSPPVRGRARPPCRAPARASRYEEQVTRTSDLGALANGAVLRPETGRELVVATGADRSRFLHGIVTGNVAGTAAGGGCLSALLTPKGHVVADMRLFVRADDIWIVVDAGQAQTVAETLSRYAIMDDFA